MYVPLNREENGRWSKEVNFFLNLGVHISEMSQTEFWKVRQGFKEAAADSSFPQLAISWEFISFPLSVLLPSQFISSLFAM
jgi:hypothetical protein